MADIKYLITVDAAGAVTAAKNFDGTLRDLEKTSDTAKTAHSGLWKSVALGQFAYDAAKKAMRLMVDVVKDSITAAMEGEKAQAALASSLATTGRNVEKMLPGLAKYADELMAQTVYDDEAIKGAMALTSQLTRLNEQGIKEATKGALGLASVFGMDLQSAARAVAQGYEGNFMALGRLIPEIRNAKTESEKHAAMVEGLAKMYGRARDETNTFSGSLKQLNNSWGELKETIGSAITNNESVRKGLKEVKTEVDGLAKSDDFKLWLSAVVDGLVWAGKAAGTFARTCAEMTQDVFGATKADADLKESKWKLADALERAKAAGHDFNQRQKESEEYSKKTKTALDAQKDSVDGLGAALKGAVEIVETKFVPSGQKMKYVLDALSPTIVDTAIPAARNLTEVIQDIEGKGFAPLPAAVESTMSRVSTIAADAARNIAESFIGLFDLHKLLISEATEFDNSYYENMMEVADAAYEAARSLIQDQLDAVKAASSEEMEAIRKKYDEALDAARAYFDKAADQAREYYDEAKRLAAKMYDEMEKAQGKAFDAQELRISRREQDEDIRYSRAYERERAAIENSSMTDKQKKAALLALEIAYENAKLARDRAREDAKLKREEAHEKKLEQIRERGRQREHQLETQLQNRLNQLANQRAAREHQLSNQKEAREEAAANRRAQAELDLMTKLLGLQKDHDTEVDKLRTAEDLARQKHADDEENRQNSLWTKVKGIFATAVEQMLIVWLTGPNSWLGGILSGTGKAKEAIEKVGGKEGLGGLADIAKSSAGGFLSALGSVGSIISGITGLLELLKGPQKATDVTYWLKLQWELQREMRDWMFINAQEKLDFYALKLNDMGLWILDIRAILTNIGIWTLGIKDDKFNAQLAKMDWIGNNISAIKTAAEKIAGSFKTPTKAALGFEGLVTSPRLFLAGESGPERVSIAPLSAGSQGGGSPGPRTVRVEVPVTLDGRVIYKVVKELMIDDSNRMGGLPLNPKGFVAV